VTGDLPEGLAHRFEVTPLSVDALDDVVELDTAYRVAVLGFSRMPREMIRQALTPTRWPSVRLGVRTGGRLVQVWWAERNPGTPFPFGTVTTHPDLFADEDVAPLETAAWQRLGGWASDQVTDPSSAELHTTRPLRDGPGCERLRHQGFFDRRVLWVMETPVDAERPVRRPPPDGLEVQGAADPRAVHAVFMRGFVGTFNHVDLSFDDFMSSRTNLPGYDPALWFVATVDGRPVGAMTMTRAAPERSAMHVSELAVLPDARGHGVATTLLRSAFATTRAEGTRLLYLFVDSESEDDAPTLYASVGFEVVQASLQLARPLGTT
jgi:GNAT superfamily N-acetyltransferase